jgi:hypothetical protein
MPPMHIILEDQADSALQLLKCINARKFCEWLDVSNKQRGPFPGYVILEWWRAGRGEGELGNPPDTWEAAVSDIHYTYTSPETAIDEVEERIGSIEGDAILYLDIVLEGIQDDPTGWRTVMYPLVLRFLQGSASRLVAVHSRNFQGRIQPFLEGKVREAGHNPEKVILFTDAIDDESFEEKFVDETIKHFENKVAKAHSSEEINRWIEFYREPWVSPKRFKKYVWYIAKSIGACQGDPENHSDKDLSWAGLIDEQLHKSEDVDLESSKALLQFYSHPVCGNTHNISVKLVCLVLSDLGFDIKCNTTKKKMRLPLEPGLPWLLAIARLRNVLFDNQEQKKLNWGKGCANNGVGWACRKWPITIDYQGTSWILSVSTSLPQQTFSTNNRDGDVELAIKSVLIAKLDGLKNMPPKPSDDSYWTVFCGTSTPCCDVRYNQPGLITFEWSAV